MQKKAPVTMRNIAPYLLLAALVVLTYANSLKNAFLWDDHFLISSNPLMKMPLIETPSLLTTPLWKISGLADAPQGYHRPMVSLFFLLNYKAWGANPAGFHLANLLLHLIAVMVLYRTGLVLFDREHARLMALMAASLFAIHPVHNEPIGRAASGEVIFGFFMVISLYAYLRDRQVLSWLAFSLALLSKEAAIMLPFAMVLLAVDRKGLKRGFFDIVPYIVIIAAYLLLRVMVIDIVLGIQAGTPALSLIITMAVAAYDYIRLLFIPYPLSPYYPAAWYATIAEPKVILALTVLLVLVMLAVRLRKNRNMLFLLLSPLVMLAPVLFRVNTFPVRQETAYIAERFLYVPAMFFSLFIAASTAKLLAHERTRNTLLLVWAGAIALFAVMSASSNAMWKDDPTLFRTIIDRAPNTAFAHNNLGVSYRKQGRLDDAAREYIAAIKINPGYTDAHNNLGVVYELQGRLEDAIREYSAALTLDPRYAAAHSNLGNVYKKQGSLDRAVVEYTRAIQINPKYAEAHNNLGVAYEMQGKRNEAMRSYRSALKINPDLADVHTNIGALYAKDGRLEEAAQEFREALRIDPSNGRARSNLTVVTNRMRPR